MSLIRAIVDGWTRYCAREMDPRPLALVRILIALCVLGDLLRAAQEGLVTVIFRTYEQGGLSRMQSDRWLWITDLSPEWGGPLAWALCVVCCVLLIIGVGVRPALVIFVIFYAQLGHLYPPGDRGIDRMVRTVLLILLFSGSHRALTLRGERAEQIPAWPAHLIAFALVLMYITAGLHKLGANPQWLSMGGDAPIYRIMADPMAGRLDSVEAVAWLGLWRILGWFTILFEVGAFILLTRWGRWWAIMGLGMHLGLALTMHLGMFSWAMLAFYPVFLGPWTCKALDWVGMHSRERWQRFR
jgi:uncharacterized membrane protein YphA (DoxX/SURF4 family)